MTFSSAPFPSLMFHFICAARFALFRFRRSAARRRFIASSAVATFGFQVVPSRVFGANSRLAVAGIGSKLLAGSYYSQTIDIFAALIAGSICAILLVSLVDIIGRTVERRMGVKP